LPESFSEVVVIKYSRCLSKCNNYDKYSKIYGILQCNNRFIFKMIVAYRYVILGWQSGSNKPQHRPPLARGVAQLLTWHQRCLEMPIHLGQSNMMSTVLAFFCGKCCQKRHLFKMVGKRYILCICLLIYCANCGRICEA